MIATHTHRGDFEPLHATASSQAAMMTLQPGETTGESSDNEHAWAEQWCFVVQGEGTARATGKKVALRPGSLPQIAPAYDKRGEPLD